MKSVHFMNSDKCEGVATYYEANKHSCSDKVKYLISDVNSIYHETLNMCVLYKAFQQFQKRAGS